MKTINSIILITILAFTIGASAALFSSCDNFVGLGAKLDLSGPVIDFISPDARKPVKAVFDLEGSVSDYTGVAKVLIKADNGKKEEDGSEKFKKQWQYKNNRWEVSKDSGKDGSWEQYSEAVWNGNKNSAKFKITIDMTLEGILLEDGEYVFSLQAWDENDNTDEYSYKTRVFLVDTNPPKVSVSDPYLYDKSACRYDPLDSNADINGYVFDTPLKALHEIEADDTTESFNPSNIGKFITNEFQLQWQINDNMDIWSVDLLLMPHHAYIDEDHSTLVQSDKIIYRYHKNLPPPPETIDMSLTQKPNGNVTVPALTRGIGKYNNADYKGKNIKYDGGEILNPINELDKVTIKVVAICYDAAGLPNQEKIMGYFIYWPLADKPWVSFTDGMEGMDLEPNGEFIGKDISEIEKKVFMIYPGKAVRVTAFQAHGVEKVNYTLGRLVIEDNKLTKTEVILDDLSVLNDPNKYKDRKYTKIDVMNTPHGNSKSLSNIFSFEVEPPARSAYYMLGVTAFGEKYDQIGVDSENEPIYEGQVSYRYQAIFRVQDITFPDFVEGPFPVASKPMFEFIGRDDSKHDAALAANAIRIYGTVSDATEVTNLSMAWINPESKNFAAMSQLAYFRDPAYDGWTQAKSMSKGTNAKEAKFSGCSANYPYDDIAPNTLWNLNYKENEAKYDYVKNRRLFDFYIDVPLTLLNIGTGSTNMPLNSQVFLLKVENPDGKASIVTYAPQGDTLAPDIKITEVVVTQGGLVTKLKPGEFGQVPKFSNGHTIQINGDWEEDSAAFLPIYTYFTPKFNIELNGELVNTPKSWTQGNEEEARRGTWSTTVTVGTALNNFSADALLDSLVVSVNATDIGGNKSETGASWLIETDTLRLTRIGTEKKDGTYNSDFIDIFLEFNRPVQLSNTGSNPTLTLNGGTNATASYVVNPAQSTRQVFRYNIASGHNTPTGSFLNVIGHSGGTNWQGDNYPFTFHRMNGNDREEIRITTGNINHDGSLVGSFYARNLPVTTTTSHADYTLTLAANRNIIIDTLAPTLSSSNAIEAKPAAGNYTKDTVFSITLNFSEPVKIGTGSNAPTLSLLITNLTTGIQTTSSNVSVNNSAVTFEYRVAPNDTTNGSPIIITTYSGSITDLAGNALAFDAISGRTQANRTLTGRFIDTIDPPAPTVRVFSNNPGTVGAINANVIQNIVNGASVSGVSTTSTVPLNNLYNDEIFIAVQGNTSSGEHDLGELEYSVDNGTNWLKVMNNGSININNTPFALNQHMSYSLVARQIDRAGNISASTLPINFTWDPGQVIERISSDMPNGTYTNVADRNTVDIIVYFRKAFYVATGSTLTLNAVTSVGGTTYATATAVTGQTGKVSSYTYRYTIANGHNIPGDAYLDVTAINGLVLWDGTGLNNGVRLNNTSTPAANMAHFPATGEARLNGSKNFKVLTGDLTISAAPAFNDSVPGAVTGTTNQNNANYHGIREDDGSYWTTLQFAFNRDVSKGEGEIVIRQNEANYRLPAVLTEAQYNRFRNIANFDTYYTKGTYGFDGTSSDTTPKYILQYRYNPQRGATSLFTGSTTDAQGPDTDLIIPNAFHDDFREVEAIKINVFSSAVTIDGGTVRVRLSSANAPQVPGATYTVTIPAGFVQDELGNSSAASGTTYNNITLGGAARPFVRIRKTQDTIATATAGANQPRLVATQPMYAFARIDSRTPSAIIRYNANTSTLAQGATISLTTGSDGNNNSNWTPAAGPKANTTAAVPTTPTTPASSTAGTAYPATGPTNYQIAIGNTDYQGLQWRIIARAFVTGTNAASSYETQEMAYRTVLTYVVRRGNAAMDTQYGSESILADGDQVWIRGGDAVDSSSIPGFPLTWADTWSELANKRAGIRLMTKVQGDSLNHSAWRWVTWDINATAYVDFIRGRDAATTIAGTTWAASSAAVAWQYGPKQIAYQRAGWTSFKTSYPVYAGQHRICDAGYDHEGKGRINFSATLNPRPASTDANNWTPTTTLNAR